MSRYFNESFNTFFKGLASHNEREWFHANKKTYEKEVKNPFNNLILDLISRLDQEGPGLKIELKNAIYRINRDIRFSKDKSPYKLHVGAVLATGGRKGVHMSGFYLHLGVEEAWIGGGVYMPEKEGLTKIRTHLLNNYEEAEKILGESSFKSHFGELKGDKNKILPKEFKGKAQGKPLIFNKQFFFMATRDGAETVVREDLADYLMSHFKAGMKWNAFLAKALE
jgi:uncharacterized protein (TIGR02453 family)